MAFIPTNIARWAGYYRCWLELQEPAQRAITIKQYPAPHEGAHHTIPDDDVQHPPIDQVGN